jgi:hypothetical protein
MRYYFLFFVALFLKSLWAECPVVFPSHDRFPELKDSFFNLLQKIPCPTHVEELRNQFATRKIETTMVSNRGSNNPNLGSYSFFEIVDSHKDEIYFGHFTALEKSKIILDQAPRPNSLLIELIAWDPYKGMYNFYELIGQRNTPPKWFYRGDSADIARDNHWLHRQIDPKKPQFGIRLRCSACHTSGGPIMKELQPPYNSWSTTLEPLNLSPHSASIAVQDLMKKTADASILSDAVRKGIHKLFNSPNYIAFQKNLSWQERLRPVFCTQEINLISGKLGPTFAIPGSYFISPWLQEMNEISVFKQDYLHVLKTLNSRFPETNELDAAHPWLAPIKGFADEKAIAFLVERGIVSRDFVRSVLAIDWRHPLFSKKRCQLLRKIPNQGENWPAEFKKNLKKARDPNATQLIAWLENPNQLDTWIAQEQKELERAIAFQVSQQHSLADLVRDLFSLRDQVFQDELSKNPLGQILEPGFRVIFPFLKQNPKSS